MANMISNSSMRPTTLPVLDIDDPSRTEAKATALRVAHKMIENYLDTNVPINLVIAHYAVDTVDGRLPAVDNQPINSIVSVTGNETYSFDSAGLYPTTTWIATSITLNYIGGMQTPIYDAIYRQAKVLTNRQNLAPELEDINLPFDMKFNAAMRSGLAPDIKQMVFPYKSIGF